VTTSLPPVFTSVQQLARIDLELSPGGFDVAIAGGFHPAKAPTYCGLLEHRRPRELLGSRRRASSPCGERRPSD
jgi:hypothetical protein